jgi:hypothetical protein
MSVPVGFHNTQSGVDILEFSGATDLMVVGPNENRTSQQIPARQIIADGAVTITNMDGTNRALSDRGTGYVYNVQAKAIVSGAGAAIW